MLKKLQVLNHCRCTLGLWDLKRSYDMGLFSLKTIPQIVGSLKHTALSSTIECTYQFGQSEYLRGRYKSITQSSNTIRFGKIVEEMDAFAGDCCYKYMCPDGQSENLPFFIVTVSVDRIEFANKIDGNKDLKMVASMMFAKRSTLVVKIECF